jgi:ABC-type Na+ efflux pump, permease component
MSKIGLIVKREYSTRVRKRSFIIMTFLGPLFLAAIYIIPILIAMNSTGEKKTIAVVDESGWFEGRFDNNEEQVFINVENLTIDSVKNMVYDGFYDIALYIPETKLNTPSNAIAYSEKQIPILTDSYIRSVMKKEIEKQKLLASGVDPQIVESVKTDVNLTTIRMDKESGEKESFTKVEFILGIALATLIYMFIISFGGQVMQGVVEEKTNRIIEVIISSVKPFQLMMGKIIGVSLVALTQFAMWVILTGAIYIGFSAAVGISQPETITTGTLMTESISTSTPMENMTIQKVVEIANSINFKVILTSFFIFFICGYLLYASLYAAIGSLVDNNTDSQQFTLAITVPLMVAIISSFYIVNNPDGNLAIWLSMIPFTSPVTMMVRIPFGVPIWQIITSIAILIISFVTLTWLAAKIYRTGILMYGKKITYKEIFKWIQYR